MRLAATVYQVSLFESALRFGGAVRTQRWAAAGLAALWALAQLGDERGAVSSMQGVAWLSRVRPAFWRLAATVWQISLLESAFRQRAPCDNGAEGLLSQLVPPRLRREQVPACFR